MKRILLFGAGKSATTLIQFIADYCQKKNHEFIVCDNDLLLAESKIKGFKTSRALSLDVNNDNERQSAISSADLVISLLPPSLHIRVAKDCVLFYKNLLTASYVDEQLQNLSEEIERRGILFISEMGLDPGIDHMSAMHIIDTLKSRGAKIQSFYSHCGGLVAPESDDNPWHYKITWNPRNVVMAGNAGARYLENGKEKHIGYHEVFSFDNQNIELQETGLLSWYANRDSISYLYTYGLKDLKTFIRTTLRYPSYNKAWNIVVHLDLTNTGDRDFISDCNTVSDWFEKKRTSFEKSNPESPLIELLKSDDIRNQFTYLGFFESMELPSKDSSSEILLYLLESRLAMKPHDRDMIVMIHEVEYEMGNRKEKLTSSLVVKGTDNLHTAMAKTVGTPLAIGAILVLEGKINLIGLHIPVVPEIYNPVLEELRKNGIEFNEKTEIISQ